MSGQSERVVTPEVTHKCERCRGLGWDHYTSNRPVDGWPVACWQCKGHGALNARELFEQFRLNFAECPSVGTIRKILQGRWAPKTERGLVPLAILAEAAEIDEAAHTTECHCGIDGDES
jgi:hypothetical protein